MGIFPEIERAWMTVDNRLYLWNFKERWAPDPLASAGRPSSSLIP